MQTRLGGYWSRVGTGYCTAVEVLERHGKLLQAVGLVTGVKEEIETAFTPFGQAADNQHWIDVW